MALIKIKRGLQHPLQIGMSVSHVNSLRGTIGGFVLNKAGQTCVLSCNHVLSPDGEASSDKDIKTEIIHPGNSNIEPSVDKWHIANWQEKNKKTFRRRRLNPSDSACAILLDAIHHIGNVIPTGLSSKFEGRNIHQWTFDRGIDVGTTVYKIGCVTGFTEGVIDSTVEKVCVRDYYFNAIRINWLDYQTPFSLGGDSGSLVFFEMGDKLYALGMVFAGLSLEKAKELHEIDGQPFSYVNSIKDVAKDNKIEYF